MVKFELYLDVNKNVKKVVGCVGLDVRKEIWYNFFYIFRLFKFGYYRYIDGN